MLVFASDEISGCFKVPSSVRLSDRGPDGLGLVSGVAVFDLAGVSMVSGCNFEVMSSKLM